MRVVQMLPTMAYGDAVGNDTIALKDALESAGYETEIYAENIDPRLPKGTVHSYSEYGERPEDVIIYHMSIGSNIGNTVRHANAKKIVVYHNVTPAHFFEPYNKNLANLCRTGIEEVKAFADVPDLCIADSNFNRNDLMHLGYKTDIKVLPILIKFEDYAKTPEQSVIDQYKDDGYTNILFTGRIAPNKKQEDIISAFYMYKTYVNPKSRLFIVGSMDKKDEYGKKLQLYAEQLDLDDVIFTGHVPFSHILAYYHLADVFVCMSEHEGFCVPLVEAMYFNVPIIAYDSTAVGETLNGAGILLKDKDPRVVSEAIHLAVSDQKLRKQMIESGKERLKDFDNDRIKKQFLDILSEFIANH